MPAPAPDEAVIEVAFGGICGSDLHYWLHGAAGESVLKAPMVLGHEIVGTVIRAAGGRLGAGGGHGRRGASGHARARAPPGTPRTGRISHRAAPTWAAPHAFPHTDGAFSRYAPAGPDAPAAAGGAGPADRGPGGTGQRRLARRVPRRRRGGKDRAGDRQRSHRGPGRGRPQTRRRRPDRGRGHARPAAGNSPRRGSATRSSRATTPRRSPPWRRTSSSSPRAATTAWPRRSQGAVRGGRVVMVGLLPSGPQPVLISLAITRELELVGSFRFNDEIDDVIAALADGSLAVDPVVTHTFAPGPRTGSVRGRQELGCIRGRSCWTSGRPRREERRRRGRADGQWRVSGARPGQTPAAGSSS